MLLPPKKIYFTHKDFQFFFKCFPPKCSPPPKKNIFFTQRFILSCVIDPQPTFIFLPPTVHSIFLKNATPKKITHILYTKIGFNLVSLAPPPTYKCLTNAFTPPKKRILYTNVMCNFLSIFDKYLPHDAQMIPTNTNHSSQILYT